MEDLRRRLAAIAPYLGAFVVLGVALSFLGPTLPELRRQTQASLDDIGLLFSAQALGLFGGSVLAGRWYDRVAGHRLLAAAMFAFAVVAVLIPVSGALAVVFGLMVVVGFCMGTVDVGANLLLSRVVDAGRLVSSLNLLHLCFAIGALLTAPLFTWSETATGGIGTALGIVAGFSLLIVGCLVVSPHPTATSTAAERIAGAAVSRHRLAIVAAFFLLYTGIEIGFSGWLFTYARRSGIDRDGATALNVLFWAGFLGGRLIMAVFGDRLDPGRVLRWCIAATGAAALGMGFVDAGRTPWFACSFALGLAVAPQWPTMLGHLHQAIPLDGRVMAWCLGGAAVGGLVIPWSIGVVLADAGFDWLPWSMVVLAVGCYLAMVAIDRKPLAGPSRRDRARPTAYGDTLR